MIRYPIFLAFSVLLMVIQTVIAPEFTGTPRLFDLLVPLVIYFSLYRPFQEGLPVILAAGITMDMLSAAPIGIYLTVYLWLYIGFRQTWRVVRVKQTLLFPFVVAIGVLFENTVFWIVILLQSGHPEVSAGTLHAAGAQLFWAAISSPVMLALFHGLFRVSDLLSEGNLQENGQP